MKTLGLDIGDQWTGIALSDELGMLARPYMTIQADTLFSTLTELIEQEPITTVVIGYPITMRGTVSEQTKKIETIKENLEQQFPSLSFVFQDERLTSKQAALLKKNKTKEDKLAGHARAAAFILSNYLQFTNR